MTQLSRRRMLLGGAAAGVGAAALTACTAGLREDPEAAAEAADRARLAIGSDTVPFHGAHQAGVTAEPPTHVELVALHMRERADREAIPRLLTVLTDDAARLTRGRSALAVTEPELAQTPARLTVTLGFGAELVRRVAGRDAVPTWLRTLPAFSIDALVCRLSVGDLLLHIAAVDAGTVAHETARLLESCLPATDPTDG